MIKLILKSILVTGFIALLTRNIEASIIIIIGLLVSIIGLMIIEKVQAI